MIISFCSQVQICILGSHIADCTLLHTHICTSFMYQLVSENNFVLYTEYYDKQASCILASGYKEGNDTSRL